MKSDTKNLSLLGSKKTNYKYDKPDIRILETFDNLHQNRAPYLVHLECSEFTSLCPKTGQPDFAKVHIFYSPNIKMVESKSLKLYLFSFRSHGEFHEDCINRIANTLEKLLSPLYLYVFGDFNIRGGIAIKPRVERINCTNQIADRFRNQLISVIK